MFCKEKKAKISKLLLSGLFKGLAGEWHFVEILRGCACSNEEENSHFRATIIGQAFYFLNVPYWVLIGTFKIEKHIQYIIIYCNVIILLFCCCCYY